MKSIVKKNIKKAIIATTFALTAMASFAEGTAEGTVKGLVDDMKNMGIDLDSNYYEYVVEEDSIDWNAQVEQRAKENKKKAKAKRNNSSIYAVADDGWCYFKDVNTNEEVRVKLPN